MKINKQKFNDLGINCDRYAEYLENFSEDDITGNHHVYPRAVYGEDEVNSCKVLLTSSEHSRAHLYLALDNIDKLSLDMSEDLKKIFNGAAARYCFNSTAMYPEDLEEYGDFLKNLMSIVRSYNTKNQHKDKEYTKIMSNLMTNLNKDPEFRRRSNEGHFTSETHPEVIEKLSKVATESWSGDNYEIRLNNMREGKLRGILNRVIAAGLELTEENFNLISAKMRGHPYWETIANFPNLIKEFNLNHLFTCADNT